MQSRRSVPAGNRALAKFGYATVMELDTDKIDDATLALLLLGLHSDSRAWKGFDWDSMDRLYEQGFISDPRNKSKSVVFTEEGLARAEQLTKQLFGKA
jgi:hypothetical protein